jgi:hypothetical protein
VLRYSFFVVALICACTSNPAAAPRIVADVNVITEAEIVASNGANAYEVIERARPRFLSSRIDLAPTRQRQVFVNGMKLGGIEQLRLIPASSVREIRFIRSFDGGGGGGGSAGAAIVVLTRTGA